MVPEVGLEPTWDCSRQILSLVRIPISPLRREVSMIRFRLGEVKNVYNAEIAETAEKCLHPACSAISALITTCRYRSPATAFRVPRRTFGLRSRRPSCGGDTRLL